MGAAELERLHQQQLLKPVLQFRLLPLWRRLLKYPALRRQYVAMGLPPKEARAFAFLVLRSPSLLAKINARWGQGAARRGRHG
jgi:hypothetical protein